MRLLLDINVLLDVLTGRQPFADESAAVLSLAETGDAKGLVAAHSVTTLHYLLAKHLGKARAASTLIDLVNIVEVVPVDHETVLQALSLNWSDFEDAVQAVCAIRAKATHLVTRNAKDFKSLNVQVLEPFELLTQLNDR